MAEIMNTYMEVGAIGIIIEIKHGIGIYVVRFHGEERWLIGSEMEVICEGR